MIKRIDNSHKYHFYGCLLSFFIGTVFLATRASSEVDAIDFTNSHLGTFEGNTTYQLSSETGILPTLELELKNQDGTIEHYKTSSGTLNLKNTRKGATVKSAILKGQTLVNIANKRLQNKENTATNGGTSTNYGFLLDGIGYEIAYPLIANKEYLIIEEWNIKSSNNIFHTAQPKIIYEDDTVSYLSSGGNLTTLGVHKLARKFIPEKNVKEFYFGLTNKAGNTVSLALNYAMIVEYQEGMENWDIPYFEGMKSVQMPVLRISNQDGSQTATISTEEEITLRSNGEVYDELDLMTGKFTQRIGEDGTVLSTPKIRILKLKTDSIFESIKQAEVDMVGTIDATIASVTLPTAPLTFRINPNLPTDQQFIASDFSITNNSQAPLTLELKEFVQTTDVLEDVHPDFYENWENLTKDQSKKIALGLVPQDSENWLTLQPGPYYVAETQNALLGHIKSNSTVDFTFTALHGQSFNQLPNPQYRLTFVFGF